MRMDLIKSVSVGLVVALTAAVSVGYAVNSNNRGGGFWRAFESSVDSEETVVISLDAGPTISAEPACVALQIGMNLLMDGGDIPKGLFECPGWAACRL